MLYYKLTVGYAILTVALTWIIEKIILQNHFQVQVCVRLRHPG